MAKEAASAVRDAGTANLAAKAGMYLTFELVSLYLSEFHKMLRGLLTDPVEGSEILLIAVYQKGPCIHTGLVKGCCDLLPYLFPRCQKRGHLFLCHLLIEVDHILFRAVIFLGHLEHHQWSYRVYHT